MIEDEHTSWLKEAEKERREYVQERIKDWPKESVYGPQSSLAGRLLDNLTKNAVGRVKEHSAHRDLDLGEKLADAGRLVTNLIQAATSYENGNESAEQPNFWRHAINPIYEVKNKAYRLMSKELVEDAANQYLHQSLRDRLYDRTLADMLIALELYHFADAMSPRHPALRGRSLIQQHPLWVATRRILTVTAMLAGIIWVAGYADQFGTSGGWVVGVCLLLWVIAGVWLILSLPFIWNRWAAARKKVLQLHEAMLMTYSQMQSDSVISARHILDSATASSAQGVVWPSPLFVLLEDVIARNGRL